MPGLKGVSAFLWMEVVHHQHVALPYPLKSKTLNFHVWLVWALVGSQWNLFASRRQQLARQGLPCSAMGHRVEMMIGTKIK